MTQLAVEPGRTLDYPVPLNQSDAIILPVDWGAWLNSGETISSVQWTADSGLTTSGASNTDSVASVLVTAGAVTGTQTLECQITTSDSEVRSVLVKFTVVNLI